MNALDRWLEDKSEAVKNAASKFPPGTCFQSHGERFWVISYFDDGTLAVTKINPGEDYEKAVATRVPICGCCLEKLRQITSRL